ncbi:hypothetical protein CASFOL_029732 [Castilleja foliolosa]|uniref:RING-type domain-containing protein n=1 Tax=Castilleja foliolosa TaxID=1961234 RepID=A0ABD3C8Q6_9LAMI
MASMVAKACSSTSSQMPSMTVQEKGSRNKRKFRADPPLADPSKPIPLPSNEFTSFEFSAEKFDTHHAHPTGCDMCCVSQSTPDALKLDLGLSCPITTLPDPTSHTEDGFHDADWSDLTETELEELVLSNLDTIFKSAIKKIASNGYSEKLATKAILRSGLWYGCKDTVSNVVDNTLAFLRSGQEIDPSREHYFEDLPQMEKYILAELVCLLREVRPFFSTGDAMWCLLICDMNVSHACAMDTDPDEVPKVANNAPNSVNEKKLFTAEGKKVSGITKREYKLRQKSMHFEKHYRTYGSKGGSRAKLSAFGGLVLDKKLKGVVPESSKNTPLSTELSLSFPVANPVPISYSLDGGAGCKWGPGDKKKEEMIMKLVARVSDLQGQLGEWTEWANQKVMQAARRLGKEKGELKVLRQEREEVERLRREKKAAEESMMKNLAEMENALGKASNQVERANVAVRRLGAENVVLRREMEAARVRAVEAAASCQEVTRREKKTMVKFRSWEKQKGAFQEDLAAERAKLAKVRIKVQLAKDVRDQVEAKLNEEEKANAELLTQASSFKKEREQMEVSTRSKEDTIKSRAQTNLQKHKDDIERLEKEISQMRLKTDSSKIAALRRGIDGSYVSKLTNSKNTGRAQKDQSAISSHASRIATATNGVKRDRECVMCLSEEMSVVFLPCAHQVVCTTCNELHEKQGMKDCPSCRAPIQRRVCVRYART